MPRSVSCSDSAGHAHWFNWNWGLTRKISCFLSIVLIVPVVQADDTAAPTAVLASDPVNIDSADLERHCRFLASDALEGRSAGSRGGQAAAAYLCSELKQRTISPPPGQREYRQPFGNQWSNVLAFIPGRDPGLKDQWVVLGAHYDHVGYGTAENSNGPIGKIHNGADDNASGVALLLELASWLANKERPCGRSVLIAFWDAEEAGLFGSKHWVAHPPVPLSKVKFALNLDMLGRLRDDRVAVMGWRSAPGLRRWIVDANRDTGLRFEFEPSVTNDSDHYPFYAAKLPTLHFDTRKHEDYHRPSDDPEKLNIPGLTRIARFAAHLVDHVVNEPTLPPFRPEALQESPQRPVDMKARTAPPVRFGVRWHTQRAESALFLDVADVVTESAAANVGLRSGDQLRKFDRWQGGTLDALRRAICVAPSEVEIEWQSPGKPEPQTARLTLPGKAIRCGITYRLDSALPGCGVITSVMAFSPADVAGLQPGDVMLTINDADVPRFEDFESRLPLTSGPCPFEIDREGQRCKILVELP